MRLPLTPTVFALLTLLAMGTVLSLTQGAMTIPAMPSLVAVGQWFAGIESTVLEPYQLAIVTELRLPRLLLAMMVGALLAQCGAVTQCLFRNPLADPGIIGVSAGAAVGAVVAITLVPDAGSGLIALAAFVAGLGTTVLIYSLARTSSGTSVFVLLLAGVAIAAFAGAVIGFLSYFTSDQQLRSLSLWQMGSLTGAGQFNLWLVLATLVLLSVLFQRQANALNALVLGESEARHLGIPVETLKRQLILLTAVGVGVAVASAGLIGFIGLVVPHIIRLLTGPNHHSLLPLSALGGGALLLLADLLARTAVSPAELPVGLVTALVGAPFFLALLLQQRRQWL